MPIQARFRALTANSKQIRTAGIVAGFTKVQNKWADTAINKLKRYPPERSGQTYVRTNNLRDSWHKNGPHLSASGLEVTVVNTARDENGRSYAIYVYGDDQGESQAWMHVGRWTKLEEVLDRDGYLRALQEVVREHIS
jgi:hypothetical protein